MRTGHFSSVEGFFLTTVEKKHAECKSHILQLFGI